MMTGEEFRSYLDSHPHVARTMLRDHSPAAYRQSARESILRSPRALRSRRLVATGRRRITMRDLDGLRREAASQ
jgi:hypothetical protein